MAPDVFTRDIAAWAANEVARQRSVEPARNAPVPAAAIEEAAQVIAAYSG